MKQFLDENFLLHTKTAEKLYHDFAKEVPVIDYHNHLPPQQIAEDIQFENLTQAWLYGDHYKWRAMRTNGVEEDYCTGSRTDWENFQKWAETVPYRSEEHRSELQSQFHLVCRLLLEKKKKKKMKI